MDKNAEYDKSNTSSDISSDETPHSFLTLIPMLEPDQEFPIKPIGGSMFPFFSGDRDTLYIKKKTAPLKRGDIVLYRRANGVFVVHRIHHIVVSGEVKSYYMLGDNQSWIEGPLKEEQMLAVVAWYDRKGKKIDCTSNRKYNLLWRFWMFIRPIRPVLLRTWHFIWVHTHSH